MKLPEKHHSFLKIKGCSFVLVDSPGIEVPSCSEMVTQYIKKRTIAPYGILLVDFTKALAGAKENLQILHSMKKEFKGKLDLAVVFTKQPAERKI